MAVEFRLLGEVEAAVDGRRLELGHARQRCVLVALLLAANRTVSVDELLARVWGPQAPQRAVNAVYSYVSRLRSALGPAGEVTISRRPGGYLMSVDVTCVDLNRFRQLVADARTASDPQTSARLFDEAIRLWQGDAFAGLDSEWLDGIRLAVHTERLCAQLDRNDLELTQGRHTPLVAELEAVAAAHPLNERLAGQLMLALYRSGRQADALLHYDRLRRRLADELGADPAAGLRQVHQRILAADAGTVSVAPQGQATAVVPHQLPATPPAFVGRIGQLADMHALLEPTDPAAETAIAVISGAGGIGKTWLALHWAHENLHRFPDGQLYVNLHGFDPVDEPVDPSLAVRGFLHALGVAPAALAADAQSQAAMLRSLTAGRRMLIVLDNARDTAHVTPLLPGGPGCTVLITSRRNLAGLIATHAARSIVLGMLTETEARQLLTRRLGARICAAEPAAATQLIRHCAGLPLALGVIAARAGIGRLPLTVLAKQLDDASTRLDVFDAGELSVNLRAVLACSYGALSAEAADVFVQMAAAPGPDLSLAAAASLTAMSQARTRTTLRQLTDAHLLHQWMPGRYRMHDLVRLYARELADAYGPVGRMRKAERRVLDHYLHSACAAFHTLNPNGEPIDVPRALDGVIVEEFGGVDTALTWFAAEHAVLVAAVGYAAASGLHRDAWQLAYALTCYLTRRGHWRDLLGTQRIALEAAERAGDQSAQARAHRELGLADIWLRNYSRAQQHLQQALLLFTKLSDRHGQAQTHRGMGRLYAHQGLHSDALPHDEQALHLYQVVGHRLGQARTLNAVGWQRAHLGDHGQALTYCKRALALYQQLGDRHGQAFTLDSIGYAEHRLGHYREAIDCYQQAADLFGRLGDDYYEAAALTSLGDNLLAAADAAAARDVWRRALHNLEQLGHPDAHEVRGKLSRLAVGTGPRSLAVETGPGRDHRLS